MMEGSAGDRDRVCPACSALCAPEAVQCWLCGAQFDGDSSGADVAAGADVVARAAKPAVSPWITDKPGEREAWRTGVPTHADASFSLSTLLLAMTLVAVGCGLLAAAPGLGIPACILLAPVLVRTSMVVRRRKERGEHVSAGEKFALIASSFMVACVILTVVGVAAVGTFCAVCLGLASTSRGGGDEWIIIVSGIATLVVVIFSARLMKKWVRNRYRRDIGEE